MLQGACSWGLAWPFAAANVISHYTAALFRISSDLVDKKHVLCVCFFERYTDVHECLNNRHINFARNAFMIDAMIKSAE